MTALTSEPLRRWGPPVAVYAGILVATLWPSDGLPDGPGWLGVAFHVLAYAVLAAAVRRAAPGWPLPGVLAVVAVLAVANEGLQATVAIGRSADALDLLADGIGGVLGLAAHRLRFP